MCGRGAAERVSLASKARSRSIVSLLGFHNIFSVPPAPLVFVNTLLARLRSFRSPRVSLILLLIGASVSVVARGRLGAGAPTRAAAVSSLDSAIASAVKSAEDTTLAGTTRLRALVSQKRDIQVASHQAFQTWLYWSLGGQAMVLAAIVSGGIALFSHLRRGPSPGTSEAA